MCVIFIKSKGKQISTEWLEKGFEDNPDGAGYAYCEENNLFVHKGFFNFQEFLDHLNSKVTKNHLCVIHFRNGNVGEKSIDNCHPFSINKDTCMFHNGTFYDFKNSKYNSCSITSDTKAISEMVIAPLINSLEWDSGGLKYILDKVLGYTNKVVILKNTEELFIHNERDGKWEDGIWFSNEKWRYKKYEPQRQIGYKSYDYSVSISQKHFDKKKYTQVQEEKYGGNGTRMRVSNYYKKGEPRPMQMDELCKYVRGRKLKLKQLVRMGEINKISYTITIKK